MTSEPEPSRRCPTTARAALADLSTLGAGRAGRERGGRTRWPCRPADRVCLLVMDGLGWELLREHPAAAPFLSELAGHRAAADRRVPGHHGHQPELAGHRAAARRARHARLPGRGAGRRAAAQRAALGRAGRPAGLAARADHLSSGRPPRAWPPYRVAARALREVRVLDGGHARRQLPGGGQPRRAGRAGRGGAGAADRGRWPSSTTPSWTHRARVRLHVGGLAVPARACGQAGRAAGRGAAAGHHPVRHRRSRDGGRGHRGAGGRRRAARSCGTASRCSAGSRAPGTSTPGPARPPTCWPPGGRRWARRPGWSAGTRPSSAGWFGPVDPGLAGRIGDVVAACTGSWAVVATRAEPRESALIGMHGSLTPRPTSSSRCCRPAGDGLAARIVIHRRGGEELGQRSGEPGGLSTESKRVVHRLQRSRKGNRGRSADHRHSAGPALGPGRGRRRCWTCGGGWAGRRASTATGRATCPAPVFADLDRDLAGPPGGPGGRHPLPGAAQFQAAMRRAGVAGGRPVVVYDDADSTAAARAWWTLRYFGHDQVRVLDGGYRAWVAAGQPVEPRRRPAPRTPGIFTARPGGMPLLDAAAAARLARSGVLLDARAGERYRGEQEPADPVAGHIPGAVSAPTAANVGPRTARLPVPRPELRAAVPGAGPAPAPARPRCRRLLRLGRHRGARGAGPGRWPASRPPCTRTPGRAGSPTRPGRWPPAQSRAS